MIDMVADCNPIGPLEQVGLEAQRKAVNDRLSGGGELISEYTEVESGCKNDRPRLADALAACRLDRATLIIAAG